MSRQLAFIDEFGNNGLDFNKPEVSTHFIITAILFNEEGFGIEENKIEAVRKKYFQTGEMKSSKIGPDDNRRLKVITDLSEINYHIFSIVVDKRDLTTEGFKYKASFYKFLHSLVDKELFRVFPQIQIVADEHGGQEFKTGFIQYIKANHVSDLFNQEFNISNSKSELAVQLADIITGTIAKCFEVTKLSPNKQDFLKLLKPKITEIRFWPPDYKRLNLTDFPHNDINSTVSELSLSLAHQFINKYGSSSIPSELDQVSCLRYLLFQFKSIDPDKYIPTFEIKGHIESTKRSKISIHYFRSKVIAKLRDRGVLLASSPKGYKLPSNSHDIIEFVRHSNSYIQPMIERVMACRNVIKLATKNSIDIIDHSEFKYLNELKNVLP